ncbi:MAG: hypothetical protein ACK42D_04535, partial [Candidatus Paceibacteria bacterium]
ILEKVRELKQHRRVIMVGGSQGGFAALRASHALEGSVSLVWNPQTSIEKFFFKKHLAGFHLHAFGASSFDEIPKELRVARRFDLTSVYDGQPMNNYVVLMQNMEDPDHLYNHAKPLSDSASKSEIDLKLGINLVSNNFVCAIGDWVGGHSLPDRATLTKMAKILFDTSIPISEILVSPKFRQCLPPSFYSNELNRAAEDSFLLGSEGNSSDWNLDRAARAALQREMASESSDWFMQYGIGNVIFDAIDLGFSRVDGVDSHEGRVENFKKKILQSESIDTEGCEMNLGGFESGDSRWQKLGDETLVKVPSYLFKPWMNKSKNMPLPSIVYVACPYAIPVCLYIATQGLLHSSYKQTKILIKSGEWFAEGGAETLGRYFAITPVHSDLLKAELRLDIDAKEVLQSLLVHLPFTEVSFSEHASLGRVGE